MYSDISKGVKQSLVNLNIIEEDFILSEDYNVSLLINDSIQFITFIVELEEVFNFDYPDEFLDVAYLNNLSELCKIISDATS